jgi:predicted nucleic acid-binding protein
LIVVDTSVWIDHLRGHRTPIPELTATKSALIHAYVLGELALGGLAGDVHEELQELPAAPIASVAEVAALIRWAGLVGTGIGYVDAHLLVSARLFPQGQLLTSDRKLKAQAKRLGLAFVH